MTPFERYLAGRYRPSVARGYGNAVRRYLDAAHAPERAAWADVLAYVDGLRRRGLHAKSLRNHLSGIKAYYRWLQAAGVREDHPCASLNLRDPVDRAIRLDGLYAGERVAEWVAGEWAGAGGGGGGPPGGGGAGGGSWPRRRQVAAGLLAHQGLMSAEAVRLGVADVDLRAGTVYVTGGGKTDSRTLYLRASQVLELDAYVRAEWKALRRRGPRGRKSDRLLLSNTGRAMHTATLQQVVNAGLPRPAWLLPLRLRQTAIAELLDAGHDVRVVQAFAGHRTATATEQYRRAGFDELAAAVRALHPRR